MDRELNRFSRTDLSAQRDKSGKKTNASHARSRIWKRDFQILRLLC